MNALNEVNKVISSVSYYSHRHNPEDEEWLTAERMAVSDGPVVTPAGRLLSVLTCPLSLFVPPAGVDPAEPHPVHRAARQSAPAAVCGEAGEDPSFCHQGESTYDAGSGQHLGCTGESHTSDEEFCLFFFFFYGIIDLSYFFQAGKHEAIVKNVHDLLAKLAWDFSPEQLDHLFDCFKVSPVGTPTFLPSVTCQKQFMMMVAIFFLFDVGLIT